MKTLRRLATIVCIFAAALASAADIPIAASLGFHRYATSVAVRFKG